MQVYRKLAFALGNIVVIGLLLVFGSILFISMSPKANKQALTFIESEVNAALYWNHVQKWVGKPLKEELFCTGTKHCYVIMMEYAWYGAPQVYFTSNFSEGVNFYLWNGFEQAWRISNVRSASLDDMTKVKLAEPGVFQTKTMRSILELYGELPYEPVKEWLTPEDVVVEYTLMGDGPFDAFALACPEKVVNGMSPKICTYEKQGRAFIPPKPFWMS
ncbi:MAG: hypothetical protein WAW13_04615 [Minisyncoccia bacterium]